MVKSIEPIENMSRDLRPVLRRLRNGLTAMLEAREVSDEWIPDVTIYQTSAGCRMKVEDESETILVKRIR
jgi:hypothetical protein